MPVNRWPVRSSVSTVFTSLTVQRIHSSSVFSKPFLTSAARTSWSVKMVPSSRSADSSSSMRVVLDGGGLELLGDALLHVARRLPDLEETRVRLVVNGVGVDARPGFRLRRKDFLDGLTHRRSRSIGRIMLLDERDLVLGDAVLLVEHLVCPRLVHSWSRHERVDRTR